MGFFNKLFGKRPKGQQRPINQEPEHAVIIRFNYGIDGLDELHNLERKLQKVIQDNNVGEYDGHEIAIDYSDGFLYMYGPNAENLFKTINQILKETTFMKGAIAKLRFGPPEEGVKEIEVEI
jgi:hypothetical protein